MTEAFEADVFGFLGNFDFERRAFDMCNFATHVVEGDDAIGVGGFDFDAVSGHGDVVDRDARGTVETTALKRIHETRDAAVGGADHIPAHVHIFAEQMTVIVGESPDATSGREEAIPFVGGELAAVETADGRVEYLHAEIVLPLGEVLEATVIEVLLPVGVIDDGESTDGVDVVDDRLTIFVWLDYGLRTDVEEVGPITSHFVAGDEDQATIVDFGVILAFGDDVMIADHEKIVAGVCVFVDDVLDGRFAITRCGV